MKRQREFFFKSNQHTDIIKTNWAPTDLSIDRSNQSKVTCHIHTHTHARQWRSLRTYGHRQLVSRMLTFCCICCCRSSLRDQHIPRSQLLLLLPQSSNSSNYIWKIKRINNGIGLRNDMLISLSPFLSFCFSYFLVTLLYTFFLSFLCVLKVN